MVFQLGIFLPHYKLTDCYIWYKFQVDASSRSWEKGTDRWQQSCTIRLPFCLLKYGTLKDLQISVPIPIRPLLIWAVNTRITGVTGFAQMSRGDKTKGSICPPSEVIHSALGYPVRFRVSNANSFFTMVLLPFFCTAYPALFLLI